MPTLLSGTIPTEIGQLAQLAVLHLYQNDLGGTLPSSISKLSLLADLSLGGNGIKGSIPSEYGNLNKLSVMYLDSNQLTGAIPGSLGKLPAITILSMHANKLSGPLPASLQNLNANTTPQFTCDDSVRNSVSPNTTINVGPANTGTSNNNNGSGNQVDSTAGSQNSGLIIGVTVGVALCVVIAVGLFLFWRNSNRKKRQRDSEITIKESPVIVTPIQERASFDFPVQKQQNIYKELPDPNPIDPYKQNLYSNRDAFQNDPFSEGDTVLMDLFSRRDTDPLEYRDTIIEDNQQKYLAEDSFDAHIERKLYEDFRGSRLEPIGRNSSSYQQRYTGEYRGDQARFALPGIRDSGPASTLFTPIVQVI
ncbi:hypothetical protein HDV01_001325 [Terramyces sp. JEL0728]|nr:hypothetical protein HDV01_001325 [Terramyces sp. JEL0728]